MSLTPSGKAHILRTGRKVKVFLQRYPGKDAKAGIGGLDYELSIGVGKAVKGTTAADGKVEFTLRVAELATLKVMDTTYKFRLVSKLEPPADVNGMQRRLNSLGYNLGAVDGIIGKKTERSILNFQADHAPLRVDGLYGPKTLQKLKDIVGE
jgi:hypothetical protein